MKIKKTNKILSCILIFGALVYYIPKSIQMLDWLDSLARAELCSVCCVAKGNNPLNLM
jgi:hypothetical protein